MKSSDNSISIRSLQHYLYCPHRWGLINIDCAWAENYFVAKANLIHDRVHKPDKYSSRKGKVITDFEVWNDDIGLYGKLDCIEYQGEIPVVIEYKPSKPKECDYYHAEAMQLFAQKLCAEYVLKKNCKASFYYADVKKRIEVDFSASYDEYYSELLQIIENIQHYEERGIIPEIEKGQYCGGCSMKDICLPKTLIRKSDIRQNILELSGAYE